MLTHATIILLPSCSPSQLKILYETLHTCIEHASSVPDLTLYTCNPMPARASQQEAVWWTKSNFLDFFPKSGNDQWDCKIGNYYVGFAYNSKILLKYLYLFWASLVLNVLNNARWHCCKSVHKGQEIRLGSQDRFSCETMGSGEKGLVTTKRFLACAKSAILIFEYMDDYISRVRT